jgi:hypothetical protein
MEGSAAHWTAHLLSGGRPNTGTGFQPNSQIECLAERLMAY